MATNLDAVANPHTPPATVAAVANEFLTLADAEPSVPCVDQMKLQKLLFYAHAWHLGFDKGALFEDDCEAWPWGPVVRDAYFQTKDFGRSKVTSRLWELASRDYRDLEDIKFVTPAGVREALKPFIKSVWDALKPYTGIQLSNSTHAPGEPWTIIKDKLGTDTKPKIPNDLIAAVFRQKVENARRNHPA